MAGSLEQILQEKKALLDGHFLLSSGLHSSRYVQCALVLQYPALADALGLEISSFFKKTRPRVVVSPALGGVIIGQSVAKALQVRAIFTERQDGIMMLRRGFSIDAGEQIVVIEDVVTTGTSTKEVIAVVEKAGGIVCGVGCIIDRSKEHISLHDSFHSLIKLPIETYTAAVCPLCKKGLPVVKPGSRK